MSERLTDEELDAIGEHCDGTSMVVLNAAAQRDVRSMLAELRERRAAEFQVIAVHGLEDGTTRRVYLSAEDVRALEWLRGWVNLENHTPSSETGRRAHVRALVALDRLTSPRSQSQ